MANPTVSFHLPLTFLLSLSLCLLLPPGAAETRVAAPEKTQPGAVRYVPVDPIVYRPVGDFRRLLAPFQVCQQCRCCALDKSASCESMPCCFGINCSIPGKPFGTCAFMPKSCNCNSCS